MPAEKPAETAQDRQREEWCRQADVYLKTSQGDITRLQKQVDRAQSRYDSAHEKVPKFEHDVDRILIEFREIDEKYAPTLPIA